jgi:hypothetical protein
MTAVYLATETTVYADHPEDESMGVLSVHETLAGAQKACEDERERRVSEFVGDDDLSRDEAVEAVAEDSRWDVVPMEVKP